ncbi:Hypothetical predicted protein [Pelobates cultripes]|uniref:Uncharacterized protein n=1 Tax=Pelobates cultripes TaxID=61616 RepID=A0AAD1SGG7_PELCU|nr:Hypothetical predicted protein [Pelobates cultripes]
MDRGYQPYGSNSSRQPFVRQTIVNKNLESRYKTRDHSKGKYSHIQPHTHTPEQVVRKKELKRPMHHHSTTNPQQSTSHYSTSSIPLHNRFDYLERSPRREDFQGTYTRDKHKNTPMKFWGKRTRSLEEGEVEEERQYRKERQGKRDP